MAGSIAASVAGAAAGQLVGKALGGKKKSSGGGGGFAPLVGGGLSIVPDGAGTIYVNPKANRTNLVNNISQGFLRSADDVRGLIPRLGSAFDSRLNELSGFVDQVRPGFGALTDARVQSIRNQRDQTISNAADDFARRGISGSSLAQSALSSIDREFAQAEGEARAQSFLEELDVSTQLTQERFQTDLSRLQSELDNLLLAGSFERAGDQTQLDDLNTQLNAGLAAMGAATQAATAANELETRLAAQNAVGQGNLAALFANKLGPSIEGIMSSSGMTGGFDPTTGVNWNTGRIGV